MVWRARIFVAAVVGLNGLSGCAPQTRAALVPRLVVHLSAADRQSRSEPSATTPTHQGRFDVVVRAALRWRTPSSWASWPGRGP